ncbi:helix-turn-helix transcriptional regulator [bacterium]|nr:helix-turn-helix transcriptional regulator [bacterium]
MDLREARFKKKLTQFDLCIKTGIQQSKISHFERGYLAPRDEERKRIAKALGVKASDLNWSNE